MILRIAKSSSRSKLPLKTVSCHSGTSFSTCCKAKIPNAMTCKGSSLSTADNKPAAQAPELGSTGGPAPMSACSNDGFYCNTTQGSTCVYISGGMTRDPCCTCNTPADCVITVPAGDVGFSSQNKRLGCQEYTPTMPNNYKGNVCYYNGLPGTNSKQQGWAVAKEMYVFTVFKLGRHEHIDQHNISYFASILIIQSLVHLNGPRLTLSIWFITGV